MESPDDPVDVPDSAVAGPVFPDDGPVLAGKGPASGVPPGDPAPDPPPARRTREPSAIRSRPNALRSAPLAVVSSSPAKPLTQRRKPEMLRNTEIPDIAKDIDMKVEYLHCYLMRSTRMKWPLAYSAMFLFFFSPLSAEEALKENAKVADKYISGSSEFNLPAYDIHKYTKGILLYGTRQNAESGGEQFLRSVILLKYPDGYNLGHYGSSMNGTKIRHFNRDEGLTIRFNADIDPDTDQIALPSGDMKEVTGKAICLRYENGDWKLLELRPLRDFKKMLEKIEKEQIRQFERSKRQRFGRPSLLLETIE